MRACRNSGSGDDLTSLARGDEDCRWRVHKFGGTSVGSAEAMLSVKAIIENQLLSPTTPVAIVVSAMGGKPKVTDLLLSAVRDAAALKRAEYLVTLDMIRKKHFDTILEVRRAPCHHSAERPSPRDPTPQSTGGRNLARTAGLPAFCGRRARGGRGAVVVSVVCEGQNATSRRTRLVIGAPPGLRAARIR